MRAHTAKARENPILSGRRPERRLRLIGRVRLEDSRLRFDDLAQGPECDAVAVGKAAPLPPVDDVGVLLDRPEELEDKPALADSGHADEGEELRLPLLARAGECARKHIELAGAADERHPVQPLDADAGSRLPCLPDGHRPRLALGRDRLGGTVVDHLLRRLMRLLPDEDAVGWSCRLQSGGRVDNVAGRKRLGAVCHERLARVDPDPQLELLLLCPVADHQCSSDGTLGVAFVRERSAEDAHHRIADELLDRAAETLQLGLDVRMVMGEEPGDVLGIHLLGLRGEADQVGEEDSHDLALLAGPAHRSRSTG